MQCNKNKGEISMTQEEFCHEMLMLKSKIGNEKWYDQEDFHREADSLMCDLLSELGYSQGVEVFRNTPKWYS